MMATSEFKLLIFSNSQHHPEENQKRFFKRYPSHNSLLFNSSLVPHYYAVALSGMVAMSGKALIIDNFLLKH